MAQAHAPFMPLSQWALAIAQNNRRALAKALTLIESNLAADIILARQLMALLPMKQAWRIGITGTPGAGKSTFIENFGMYLIKLGFKPAILAIDPASLLGGGAIMGDKTRMELLSRQENAFIRPSSALGSSVHKRSFEAIRCCEAAGYNPIILETIGVGQSETHSASLTDMFCVVIQPAGGDELQAMKRGIMELADMVIINKSDGEYKSLSAKTEADYKIALKLMMPQLPNWQIPVQPVSSLYQENFDKIFKHIQDFMQLSQDSGYWQQKRQSQNKEFFQQLLFDYWLAQAQENPIYREISEKIATQSDANPFAIYALIAQ